MSDADDDIIYVTARLSEKIIEKIQILVDFANLKNKTQAVADAVAVADWFENAREDGAKIIVKNPRGSRSRITTIWKSQEEMNEGRDGEISTTPVEMGIQKETYGKVNKLYRKIGLANETMVVANAIAFTVDLIKLVDQGADIYVEYPDDGLYKTTIQIGGDSDLLTISDHRSN